MNKHRKHYDDAYKFEVSSMVANQRLSITQVVIGMSLGRTAVAHWIEQYWDKQQEKPISGRLSLPSSSAYANGRTRTISRALAINH